MFSLEFLLSFSGKKMPDTLIAKYDYSVLLLQRQGTNTDNLTNSNKIV